MSLSELEQHILACYLAGHGQELNIANRFYPYGELVLVLEDKVKVATRKFGFKVTSKAKAVGNALLDQMIETGAFSTKQNEFGGTMHQFQSDVWRDFLKQQAETNPILVKAQAAGPDFWDQAFADLTNS